MPQNLWIVSYENIVRENGRMNLKMKSDIWKMLKSFRSSHISSIWKWYKCSRNNYHGRGEPRWWSVRFLFCLTAPIGGVKFLALLTKILLGFFSGAIFSTFWPKKGTTWFKTFRHTAMWDSMYYQTTTIRQNGVKKLVGKFLEFFSFYHKKLHFFSRFSQEIKNQENWEA